MTVVGVVPAAAQALAVLQYLGTQAQPTAAAAISRDLDLPRSTTYHLLDTLVRAGFVVHVAEEQRYALGIAVYELASGYGRQTSLQRLARTPLAVLVDSVGQNGHLAIMHGRDVIYVIEERASGRPEDRVEDLPGFTEPAPFLVRDRPRQFVAGQQGPGIVRAQDADAVIECLPVARFGCGPVSPAGSDPGELVAAEQGIVIFGAEDPQLGLEVLPVPGFGRAQVTVVCHRPRHRVPHMQDGAVPGSKTKVTHPSRRSFRPRL
jgi:hypothetical protein